ncbi:MAG: lytic transglycosylase domain-containing protein [Candidatus Moranbacteria bacterium]|nr:lytic transglycosylase domain-containing protein [Candidatus Moranbacteria bacterium]
MNLKILLIIPLIFLGAISVKPPPVFEEDYQQYISMAEFNKKYIADLEKIKALGAPDSLAPLIYSKSVKYGFDSGVVTRLIKIESSFNKFALSNKGAIGLMQTTQSTCKAYNLEYSYEESVNIDNGLYILSDKLNQYGTLELALHSYNGGWKAVKYKFNSHYVKSILD